MQRGHGGARAVDEAEGGFTLLELMIVVLIIAILIAVMMPVIAGATTRANDRAAQVSLRNALTAAKTFYTDNQTYGDDTALAGSSIETSLKWGTATTDDVHVVLSADTLGVCIQATSKSGTVFELMDLSSGGAAGTYYAKLATGCPTPPDSGSAAPAGFKTGGW